VGSFRALTSSVKATGILRLETRMIIISFLYHVILLLHTSHVTVHIQAAYEDLWMGFDADAPTLTSDLGSGSGCAT